MAGCLEAVGARNSFNMALAGSKKRAPSRTARRVPVSKYKRLLREQGAVVKDWGGRLATAIIYPNTYYIGMSNLGVHSLYALCNNRPDCAAERVFMSGDGGEPLSIESRRPCRDFSVLFCSVSYEPDYYNLIQMLKQGALPPYSRDRSEECPLIIGGGAALMANPAPLKDVFDVICIGEAEQIMPGVLDTIKNIGAGDREALLIALSDVEGCYVPVLHKEGQMVKRRWLENSEEAPSGTQIITEDTEMGNLFMVEVGRGCAMGCRFCLVSISFSPVRFYSLKALMEKVKEGALNSKRIGLVSPMVSAHPQLEELLEGILGLGLGFSVSSLRVKPISDNLVKLLVRGGVKSIAIAPEAGSQRLRNIINKKVSEEDVLKAVSVLALNGVREIKLYFMVGLPGENDEDIEQLILLAEKCREKAVKEGRNVRLSVNIAPFIPKAGTPFQWFAMAEEGVLKKRINLIKKALMPKGIVIKSESPSWSIVQGALSRGGEGIAKVLCEMESFTLAEWRRAVDKTGFDPAHYVYTEWGREEKLPWYMVDNCTSGEKLWREFEVAKALSPK